MLMLYQFLYICIVHKHLLPFDVTFSRIWSSFLPKKYSNTPVVYPYSRSFVVLNPALQMLYFIKWQRKWQVFKPCLCSSCWIWDILTTVVQSLSIVHADGVVKGLHVGLARVLVANLSGIGKKGLVRGTCHLAPEVDEIVETRRTSSQKLEFGKYDVSDNHDEVIISSMSYKLWRHKE